MKHIFACLALFLFSSLSPQKSVSQILLEPGFSLSFAENHYAYTPATTTLHHDEAWMGLGFGLEFRAHYLLSFVSLGATSLAQWEAAKYRTTSGSIFTSTEYAVTNFRYGLGPTAHFHLPIAGLRIVTEYFIYVKNQLTYADETTANPLRKGDSMSGTGWGLGVVYKFLASINAFAIYRNFTFDSANISGASLTLPSSNYSRFTNRSLFVGGTYTF